MGSNPIAVKVHSLIGKNVKELGRVYYLPVDWSADKSLLTLQKSNITFLTLMLVDLILVTIPAIFLTALVVKENRDNISAVLLPILKCYCIFISVAGFQIPVYLYRKNVVHFLNIFLALDLSVIVNGQN